MGSDYSDSIFRIESREPRLAGFGTGFALYEDHVSTYVATCRHVINSVGGPANGRIKGLDIVDVYADWENRAADIAIATTAGKLNSQPLSLCEHPDSGDDVTILGFEKSSGGFTRRSVDGCLLSPIQKDSSGQQSIVHGWDIKVVSDIGLVGGYSGAPVILSKNGCVAGITTRHFAGHTIAEAIGTRCLVELMKQLCPEIILHEAIIPDHAGETGLSGLKSKILSELALAEARNQKGLDIGSLSRNLKVDEEDLVRCLSVLCKDACIRDYQRLNDSIRYEIRTKGKALLG